MTIPNASGLYAITDCENITTAQLLEKTECILDVGIALLQYRNKTEDYRQKKNLALQLQSRCHKYTTPFIVNDDLRLAHEIAADGIHLGKNDPDIKTARHILGNSIIGLSCYNDFQRALFAEQSGADYIAFGAFFSSNTKPDALKADVDLIVKAKKNLTTPIVAIGGITPENAKTLIDAGADYIAVVNGLFSTTHTANATLAYNALFDK